MKAQLTVDGYTYKSVHTLHDVHRVAQVVAEDGDSEADIVLRTGDGTSLTVRHFSRTSELLAAVKDA